MSDVNKTPIGIHPIWLVTEQRLAQIKEAIDRYRKANLVINPEWFEEFYELYAWLVEYRSKKEEKS